MDLGGENSRGGQYVQVDEMSPIATKVHDWLLSNPGQHTYLAVGEAVGGIHPKAVGSIMRALDARGLNLGHRVVKTKIKLKDPS
jgi:hypothetical protein